jgi:deazaflavin-dependent oxidoreductase (nitroreductase family)
MPLATKPPRGALRLLFRAPVWAYRLKVGWLLGGRFLLLAHRGRRSGRTYETVLEVIGRGERGSYYVIAAWGDRADWLRNVRAQPHVRIRGGRQETDAEAVEMSPARGLSVLREYEDKHRRATRWLLRAFGDDSIEDMAERARVVELVPIERGYARRTTSAPV